jgi:arsenate reductase (glutaredoxin)
MMSGTIRFYHNPRCSKSREVKRILDDNDTDYETVLYLDEPPSKSELLRIAKMVEGGASSLLRIKEAREDGWDHDEDASDETIIAFIAKHPRALQRPIVVDDDNAVVGRPPERVQEILG